MSHVPDSSQSSRDPMQQEYQQEMLSTPVKGKQRKKTTEKDFGVVLSTLSPRLPPFTCSSKTTITDSEWPTRQPMFSTLNNQKAPQNDRYDQEHNKDQENNYHDNCFIYPTTPVQQQKQQQQQQQMSPSLTTFTTSTPPRSWSSRQRVPSFSLPSFLIPTVTTTPPRSQQVGGNVRHRHRDLQTPPSVRYRSIVGQYTTGQWCNDNGHGDDDDDDEDDGDDDDGQCLDDQWSSRRRRRQRQQQQQQFYGRGSNLKNLKSRSPSFMNRIAATYMAFGKVHNRSSGISKGKTRARNRELLDPDVKAIDKMGNEKETDHKDDSFDHGKDEEEEDVDGEESEGENEFYGNNLRTPTKSMSRVKGRRASSSLSSGSLLNLSIAGVEATTAAAKLQRSFRMKLLGSKFWVGDGGEDDDDDDDDDSDKDAVVTRKNNVDWVEEEKLEQEGKEDEEEDEENEEEEKIETEKDLASGSKGQVAGKEPNSSFENCHDSLPDHSPTLHQQQPSDQQQQQQQQERGQKLAGPASRLTPADPEWTLLYFLQRTPTKRVRSTTLLTALQVENESSGTKRGRGIGRDGKEGHGVGFDHQPSWRHAPHNVESEKRFQSLWTSPRRSPSTKIQAAIRRRL